MQSKLANRKMRNQAKLFKLSFALGVSCSSCAFSAEASPSEADPAGFFSGVFFSVDFIDGEVMALKKLKRECKIIWKERIYWGRSRILFSSAQSLFLQLMYVLSTWKEGNNIDCVFTIQNFLRNLNFVVHFYWRAAFINEFLFVYQFLFMTHSNKKSIKEKSMNESELSILSYSFL